MKTPNSFRTWVRISGVLVLLVLGLPLAQARAIQGASGYVYLVRKLELGKLNVNGLGGLAYSPQADSFLVLQAQPGKNGRVVTGLDRHENLLGITEMSGQPATPLDIAFNARENSLMILDSSTQGLAVVRAGMDGTLPPTGMITARYSLKALGIPHIEGMDFDPGSGRLFLLDPSGKRLFIVTPDPVGSYDAGQAKRENRVTIVDLTQMGENHMSGLAYHPGLGHLFTVGRSGTVLYEFTANGELLNARDITSFGLKSLASIVVAPSGDETDDASVQSLYLGDAGANLILEVSITAPMVMALPPASPAALVNKIASSGWKSPSPDPSGIDYNPFTNQLVVSDSEIDEMTMFTGVNVYQASTSGSLQSTCSTMAYTREPSGLAVNTDNGNIFISDDGKVLLHEISLGRDKRYCTADDRVSTIDTTTYGSIDPEGVAYGNGEIIIADGLNTEVFIISPGTDGVFNGGPPSGDDVVISHFDTSVMGLRDPEGIDFHPTRGTLFIVSRPDMTLVETSMDGNVLRVFDLTPINIDKPSGVAIGPGSIDPSFNNIYVSQRGVDNNVDPNENDGVIYELNIDNFPVVQTPGPSPTQISTPDPLPLPFHFFLPSVSEGV